MDLDSGSPQPHQVPGLYLRKWQRLVDLLAEVYAADAVLISCVGPAGLRVQVASCSAGPLFEAGGDRLLPAEAYCATVVAGRAALAVDDAEQDPQWRLRLAANGRMRAYLGVPLLWPDKTVYGTLCVLAREAAPRSAAMRGLLGQLRQLIESDFRALHFVRAVDQRAASLESLIQARTLELQRVNSRAGARAGPEPSPGAGLARTGRRRLGQLWRGLFPQSGAAAGAAVRR